MQRGEAVTLVGVLAGSVYAGYGAFTETGAVGWLNVLQQRVVGAYYPLLSFGLVLVCVQLAVTLAADGIARLRGEPGGATSRALWGPGRQVTAWPERNQVRQMTLLALGVLVAIWLAAGGIIWWAQHQARIDATAEYQPIRLAMGAPVPAQRSGHLVVTGILRPDLAVTHSTDGREDYRYVPVVGPGFERGQPLELVIKLGASQVLPSRPYVPRATGPAPTGVEIFVRNEGPVPSAARDALPGLSPSASVLALVPTADGKPVEADTSWVVTGTVLFSGVASAIPLMLPLIALREAARRRRLAGKCASPGA
jgi:hypothetical protein